MLISTKFYKTIYTPQKASGKGYIIDHSVRPPEWGGMKEESAHPYGGEMVTCERTFKYITITCDTNEHSEISFIMRQAGWETDKVMTTEGEV